MLKKLEKIVVRVTTKHSSWIRRRAWFCFTTTPSCVKVNKEQKEQIIQDNYLKIITKWTAFKQWIENEQKTEEIINRIKTEENAEQPISSKFTKMEIIEKLIEKWLIKWQDFNEDARSEDLLFLLNS